MMIDAALEELQTHAAPVIAWRTWADLGRLKSVSGDVSGGREAFAQAAEIVNGIAANIIDSTLHQTFLNSAAVREINQAAQ